jgi:hypothetical protein
MREKKMLKQLKVLPGLAMLATAALAPCVASAQVSDQWQFGAQIYAFLPTVEGTANFPASGTNPGVSVNADEILDSLNFAFMGSLEAKKGRWGAFTDLLYVNIGENKSGVRNFTVGGIQVPGTASASVNYDLKAWTWTIAGEYVAVAQPGVSLDLFAGARLLDIEQDINWGIDGALGGIPIGSRTGDRSAGDSNWDFIVGAKGRLRFGADNRWFIPYYIDVGTGDSDITWQGMAGLGYSWKSVDFYVAYRYLDYDLGDSKPFSDLTLGGPVIALAFRW